MCGIFVATMTTKAMTFYRTSVGKKVVMAITGFIAFTWVTIHMIGNLQIYLGAERLNAYGELLHSMGSFLWVFRGIMTVVIISHIVAATQVTLQNIDARPTRYKIHRFRETTYAARTMWWGGPLVALFLLYHLMHLTFGNVHADFTDNIYNNVVFGFQTPWTSGVYIVAMLMLGLHLYHGVWSMFQSVGANHPKWNKWRRIFAVAFGLAIAVGNISIPVAVLSGIVKPV